MRIQSKEQRASENASWWPGEGAEDQRGKGAKAETKEQGSGGWVGHRRKGGERTSGAMRQRGMVHLRVRVEPDGHD